MEVTEVKTVTEETEEKPKVTSWNYIEWRDYWVIQSN